MLQIHGVKGEAVVSYREPLTMRLRRTGSGDAVSSAFQKGKKHGNFSRLFGSHDVLTPKMSIEETENLVILFFNHPLPCFLCNDRVNSIGA